LEKPRAFNVAPDICPLTQSNIQALSIANTSGADQLLPRIGV
jgi:hypothetical protein